MSARLSLLLVVTVIAAAGTAEARRVDPSGAGDFLTVQAAVAAATDGETITVAAGQYPGALDLTGLNLTIEGDDRETVEITGDASGSVVTIGLGSQITLRRLSIGTGDARGGDGYGGCLSVLDSSPIIEDVRFHGCAANDGGCVSLRNSDAELSSVIVRNCTAWATGTGDLGRGHGGGLWIENGAVVIEGMLAIDNTAEGYGGGMALRRGDPHVQNARFQGNDAVWGGGAVLWGGSPVLDRVNAMGNVACSGGGGLSIYDGTAATIIGSAVLHNDLQASAACAAPLGGGGIWVHSAEVEITASWIAANDAATGLGGGISVNDQATAMLIRTVVAENEAARVAGVYATSAAERADLDACRVSHNEASQDYGGGLFESPLGTAHGVLFLGNSCATGSFGGGFSVETALGGDGLGVSNSIFASNSAGYGSGLSADGQGVTITNNTFYQSHAWQPGAGTIHVDHRMASRTVEIRNNIVAGSLSPYDVSSTEDASASAAALDWNLLGGGTSGTVSSTILGGAGDNGLTGPAVFQSTSLGSWESYLRLDPTSDGVDDGEGAFGQDPDGSPTDRGAFGGEGAEVWARGDLDGDGYTVWEGDCNDNDSAIHPGADELCDCLDDDCDTWIENEPCDLDAACDGSEGTVGDDDDATGDDDDATGDDDDQTGDDDSADDDDATGDDDDQTGDDDDVAGFAPAAGCLGSCDAAGGGGGVFGLLVLVVLGRRRRGFEVTRRER